MTLLFLISFTFRGKIIFFFLEAPIEDQDVWEIFAKYVEGKVDRLPWCAESLQLETVSIIERLSNINRHGFLTINSQPQLNGVDSEDPVFGWGGSGGVVYQKAYLEFFTSTNNFNQLKNMIEQHERNGGKKKFLAYFKRYSPFERPLTLSFLFLISSTLR